MLPKLTSSGIGILAISLILMIQSANAEVLCWDFTVHPTLEAVPMAGVASDAAWPPDNGVYTPYGGTIAGTGLQGDGTAIFADAPTENANSGFVRGGWGAFTLDVRVKVLEDVTQGAGKSMSIVDCTNNGRGVKLRTDGMQLVSGSGVVAGYGYDGTQWQIIRFSLSCNGTVEVCLWDANASSWITLGNQGLGGSGWNIGGVLPGGFAIGSMAGSTTQSGKFQIDWARVDNTQALGCNGNPLPKCYEDPCGSTLTPSAGIQSVSGLAGGLPVTLASVNCGSPDVSDGLTVIGNNPGFDGNTVPAEIGGRNCRRNLDPAKDGYIFFAIDNTRAHAGSQPDVDIVVEYYDTGTGSLALQYDVGPGNEYADGGSVAMLNDNKWKTHTFTITGARFSEGQAWGGDFRFGTDFQIRYLDKVSVVVTGNHGPSIDYLLYNSGSTSLNWDVIEANADGTTHDYGWLSLTTNPATTVDLATGNTASIKATVDTTTMTTPDTAYLKFTDGCTPTTYSEPFTPYTAGNLTGQGGWVATNAPDPFTIEINGGNTELKLNGSADGIAGHEARHGVTGFEGQFSVKVKVKQGGALSGRELNNFWAFHAYDASGTDFGWWRGTPTTVKAKNPADASVDPTAQPLTSTYKTLEFRINTATQTTTYYINDVQVASYQVNASGGLAGIKFERIPNAADISGSEYVYLDDAEVTAIEQYRIRRINVSLTGCSYAVDPGPVLVTGGCTDSSGRSFAVINNGATTITGFTVDTVALNSGPTWPHVTFPWLPGTWPRTISATLAPGESQEVVATIDWTQLAVGVPETALLKFNIPGCPDELGETKVALTADKIAVPTNYQTIVYDGGRLPETSGSAGGGQTFTTFDTTAGLESRISIVDDPEAVDGKAFRLNDSSDDQTKYYSTPAANIVPATGATVVARLKTESFFNAGTPRRTGNIWIWGPSISAQIFWGGDDGYLREGLRGGSVNLGSDPGVANPTPPPDTIPHPKYHVVRVTSRDMGGSLGIVINVYFDEDPIPVLHLTNQSVQNSPAEASGFGFGVISGSDVQPVDFDCFAGTDAGAFAPGEEEACLGHTLLCPSLCSTPFADVDGDHDVDQDDFAVFQLCYTGPDVTSLPPGLPEYCACLDHADDDNDPLTPPGPDGNIDSFDLTAFERCASGPAVPADPNCGG